jgi:hypothetical protein
MASRRTLAFLSSPQNLERVPRDAGVLPLSPRIEVPRERLVARTPESLLTPEDGRNIEDRAARLVARWVSQSGLETALRFEGLAVGDCFAYELGLVARDLVKTAWILRRSLEQVGPDRVIADRPPLIGPVPAYPYLAALGSLLASRDGQEPWRYESLSPTSEKSPRKSRALAEKGYVALASRQGLRRLKSGHPLVAVGPFPEFYHPVAVAAKREGVETVALVRGEAPLRPSSREGLFLLTIEALLNAGDREQVREYAARATKTLDHLSWPEGLNAGGFDLTASFRRDVQARLRRDGSALASTVLGFGRGLERAEAILLVESLSPFAKAIVRGARAHSVPTTLLQHGVLAGAFSYGASEGDRVAAWGPADAEWFRRHLRAGVRAEPTGSPRHEALLREAVREPVGVLRSIPPGGPIVLFASQPFVQDRAGRSPWERTAALDLVIAVSRRIPEAQLIIKWHPSESPEGRIDSRILQAHREDTIALLRRADAVLVVSSTVALEAMLLDRPVVFLGPTDPESAFHPPEDGGGLRAQNEAELESELRGLLGSDRARDDVVKGQRAYLARAFTPVDGHAAVRVVRLARGR